MGQLLIWTKNFFDANYQVFKGADIQGSIIFDSWKNNANVITKEHTYLFQTSDLFHPVTRIIETGGKQIGSIRFNSWQMKATLYFGGSVYYWKYTSFMMSSWELVDQEGKRATYTSHTGSGTILSESEDEIPLLAGLFIQGFFNRVLLLSIAVVLFMLFIRSC